MKKSNGPCSTPSPTEEEVATLPGAQIGTALRIRVETAGAGYVRLEHLAYNSDLGWYTQKTFCLPAELIGQLVPQLRKAECMVPRKSNDHDGVIRFPGPSLPTIPRPAQRRDA